MGWDGAMLVVLVMLGLAFGGPQSARGEDLSSVTLDEPGIFELGVEARFVPRALPAEARSPVGFKFSLEMLPIGAGRIPQLSEVVVDFAQDISVETQGLSVCRPTGLVETDVEAVCPDAIVGRGRSNFEIAFPEQGGRITTSGGMAIVNAGGGLKLSKLYALGSVSIPSPEEFSIPIEVTRAPGSYGNRLAMAIPNVAGRSGALSELDLAFSRGTRSGSLFAARCVRGELSVRVIARLRDGSTYKAHLHPPCTSRDN